jgi:hypothetical protein
MMENAKKSPTQISKKSQVDDGIPIEIVTGGLYSPFPILAYQVLYEAKEHVAKDVLMCFTSHLGYGKSSNCVWPSITKICKESGRSRSAVVRGYRILVEFGFIKIGKYKSPNGPANRYYFQPSCYHTAAMNERATEFTKVFGQCEACFKIVRDPEVGSGLEAFVHYGCGGNVRKLARVKRELYTPDATKIEAS